METFVDATLQTALHSLLIPQISITSAILVGNDMDTCLAPRARKFQGSSNRGSVDIFQRGL